MKKEKPVRKRKPINIREKLDALVSKISFILTNRITIPDLKKFLYKAGIELNEKEVAARILNTAFMLNLGLSVYLIYRFFILKPELVKGIVKFLLVWFVGIMALVFIIYFSVMVISAVLKRKTKKISIFKQIDFKKLVAWLIKSAIILNIALNVFLFYSHSNFNVNSLAVKLFYTLLITLMLWCLGFVLLLLSLWCCFFAIIDLKIYQRKKQIEEVFPDFLQLTSANISAGMPIDRALWFAVRPRFGVLANEIEDVAKSTLVGEKLGVALQTFADKYESLIVQRSINLLLEGLEAGGEIADLLNRVAKNIVDTRIIKREMASNVTTYVIFISFAALVGAPFLFGLSTELIVIMQSILGNIDMGSSTQSYGGIGGMMTASPDSIAIGDYKIFAVICIIITSFFSSVLVTIIRKGEVKEGLHLIPIFIGIGLVVYFIAISLLHLMLSGFFA